MAEEMEIIMEKPIKEPTILDSVIDPSLKKKPKIEPLLALQVVVNLLFLDYSIE